MPTKADQPAPPKRPWTPPTLTCLQARPEVTAYSGDIGPWAIKRR